MKLKDIVNKYDIDEEKFKKYLKKSGAKYKISFTGAWILEDDVEGNINRYKEYLQEEAARKIKEEEEKERQRLEEEKNREI